MGRLICGEIACVFKVDELDLNASRAAAECFVGPGKRICESTHGSSFGQTVTADHWGDDHGNETLGVFGNRTAAVQADSQATTSSILDLAEDDRVNDTGAQAGKGEARVAHHHALGSHASPKQVLGDGVHLSNLCHDTLLDGLPYSGDTDQDGRLELANVTGTVLDGGIRDGFWIAIAHGAAPEETGILEDEFQDVCKREVGEQAISWTEVRPDDDIDTSD